MTTMQDEALDRRYSGYAAKFVNECDGPPTDKNLKKHLAGCVRKPRPEEYDAIRPHVAGFRETRITDAITAAQIPGLHNMQPGRLDNDSAVVRFDIGERLQGGVGENYDGYVIALGARLADDDGNITRETMQAGSDRVGTIAEIGPALARLVQDVRNRYSDIS